jgi:hypothetical protein
MLHHDELIRPHRARADVPHLPASDEVVESFHGLFDGGEGIEAMDLEEIDVVRTQAFQRGVDCIEDRLAGKAWRVSTKM